MIILEVKRPKSNSHADSWLGNLGKLPLLSEPVSSSVKYDWNWKISQVFSSSDIRNIFEPKMSIFCLPFLLLNSHESSPWNTSPYQAMASKHWCSAREWRYKLTVNLVVSQDTVSLTRQIKQHNNNINKWKDTHKHPWPQITQCLAQQLLTQSKHLITLCK